MTAHAVSHQNEKRLPASPWIVTPLNDLVLFVGTPLLILPLFFLAGSHWGVEEITLFVFAFGQLGHNFPGMLRAYGDRELFRRHRLRFIVAPIVLLLASGTSVTWDLHGLILISATWGIWHALMQTYGLLRIYDAKFQSFAATTRRLDVAMCLCWFGLAVAWSPDRAYMLFDLFLESGGPLLLSALIQPAKLILTALTAVITLAFVMHTVRCWMAGQAPSPVKLLLLSSSVAFYWYTNVAVSNILLGLAMFEVFHDVQYLAIVWVYNCNRAEKSAGVGAFTRFLFRRSGALLGLYLGLIFAYGSLYYLEHWTTAGSLKNTLTVLLATSAMLHYYYDGFIWKIRDNTTRQSLEIKSDTMNRDPLKKWPGWLKQFSMWGAAAWLVVSMGVAEYRGSLNNLQRLYALNQAIPNNARAQLNLGYALQLQGNSDQAARFYVQAIEADAGLVEAYNNLALIHVERGQVQQGITLLRQSLQLDPDNADTHNNLGNAYAQLDDVRQALHHFRRSLTLVPNNPAAHTNLGITFAQAGKLKEAESHLRRAVNGHPQDIAARFNLGSVLAQQRKLDEAAAEYRAVLEIDPRHRAALDKINIIQQLQQQDRVQL